MEHYIDIHCHCLPGIDDGAGSLEESVEMIQIAYRDGIRAMILTPHHHYRRGAASPEVIQEKTQELRSVIKETCPDMVLYTGNELYYFSDLPDLIEEEKVCRMAGSDCVLVEFSPEKPYQDIRNAMYRIQTLGRIPILAHVERYVCLVEKIEHARELSAMGVYFQANASGVLGHYGRKEKKFLKKLFKEGRIHFVASDAHDTEKRRPELSECAAYLKKKFGQSVVDECMYLNPVKLIKNTLV